MSACEHVFADPRRACVHPAVGATGRCLWHNAAVAKDDPYVRALFLHADGAGTSFAECHLAGLDLHDLALAERDFAAADLRDAALDGCVLERARFAGANLSRATLRRADLRGADLRGANLAGATLAGADLRGADLAEAIIDATVLLGADLRDADLSGAQIISFRWNRLTRFQGVRGFEPRPERSEDEVGQATQLFLAPVALTDVDSCQRLAAVDDADIARTRVFTAGRSGMAAAPMPGDPPAPSPVIRPGLRWPWLIVPALAGLLIGGGVMTVLRPVADAPGTMIAAAPVDDHELAELRAQRAADRAQITSLQDRASALADQLATAQQGAGADAVRTEHLRQELLDAQADLARLLDADDRAAALALDKAEGRVLARDLAAATARQERLAKILADGVGRFRDENVHLTAELGEARARVAALEQTQGENVRLKQKLTAVTQERDTLTGLYQGASGELASAKRDIERYLARISGSQLAGLLNEEGAGAPLMPVVAGKPVSLGGDYLVSLTVAPGKAGLDVSLIVQRPAAAANPDATVVLYDARKRPLRRLSASFPHVDLGAPFVSLAATVSCDRMPAYARVVLAPGIDDVAAR